MPFKMTQMIGGKLPFGNLYIHRAHMEQMEHMEIDGTNGTYGNRWNKWRCDEP